jgi:hypothetical protein
MNFKQWLESGIAPVNSVLDALKELKLKTGASKEQITKAFIDLSNKHHPDKPSGSAKKQKKLNAAFEYLRDRNFDTQTYSMPSYDYRPTADFRTRAHAAYERREVPAWETDERSTYFEIGSSFNNLNYCKKKIYEKAMENIHGSNWQNIEPHTGLNKWTVWAWDGRHFRGTFTVWCNKEILGYVGKVMQYWNKYYYTEAVFAHINESLGGWGGTNVMNLIRLKGIDVAEKGKTFEHGSFNNNPENDYEFCRELQWDLNKLARNWNL